jgi:hypothetical protein
VYAGREAARRQSMRVKIIHSPGRGPSSHSGAASHIPFAVLRAKYNKSGVQDSDSTAPLRLVGSPVAASKAALFEVSARA